jgi:hypothetical protein
VAAADETGEFEIRLANGDVERAASLWGARHMIARRVAFDTNPVDPRNVLPAEIWKKGSGFGGRSYVETIHTAAELSTTD